MHSNIQAGKMFRVTVLAIVRGILWWETFSISLPLPLLAKHHETVCYNKATFINRIYKTKTLTNKEIPAKLTKICEEEQRTLEKPTK